MWVDLAIRRRAADDASLPRKWLRASVYHECHVLCGVFGLRHSHWGGCGSLPFAAIDEEGLLKLSLQRLNFSLEDTYALMGSVIALFGDCLLDFAILANECHARALRGEMFNHFPKFYYSANRGPFVRLREASLWAPHQCMHAPWILAQMRHQLTMTKLFFRPAWASEPDFSLELSQGLLARLSYVPSILLRAFARVLGSQGTYARRCALLEAWPAQKATLYAFLGLIDKEAAHGTLEIVF